MKLYLIDLPCEVYLLASFKIANIDISSILTIGKWYYGDLIPMNSNSEIFNKKFYVIRCDDNRLRRVNSKYLITQEEWRQNKLNELGI